MKCVYISLTFDPGSVQAVRFELAVDEIVQRDLLSPDPGPGVVRSHPDHAEGDQGQHQHDHHQRDQVCSPVPWRGGFHLTELKIKIKMR